MLVAALVFALDTTNPNAFKRDAGPLGWREKSVAGLVGGLEILVMATNLASLAGRVRRSRPVTLAALINGWITLATGFAAVYMLLFVVDKGALHVEGWSGSVPIQERIPGTGTTHGVAATESRVLSVMVAFVYFSLCTFTSAGFGDIYPLEWPAQLAASVQMLVGAVYAVVIFGAALCYFQSHIGEGSTTRSEQHQGCFRGAVQWVRYNVYGVEAVRRGLVSYLFPAVLVLQAAGIGTLIAMDPELLHHTHPRESSAYVVFSALQGVLLVVLVSVSLRIAFKMHDNVEIGLLFLVQSYLSMIFLFDGVYLLVYLLNKDAFELAGGKHMALPEAMWRFLYFSFTAMTTTGYGDITPRLMVSRVVVGAHMVTSVVYHVLILGLGTALFVSRQRRSLEKVAEEARRRNNWFGLLEVQMVDQTQPPVQQAGGRVPGSLWDDDDDDV